MTPEELERFDRVCSRLEELAGRLVEMGVVSPDVLKHDRTQERPTFRLVGDQGWAEYLAGHPELTEQPELEEQAVLDALRHAISESMLVCEWASGAVMAADVAACIFGRPLSRGQILRVARRLQNLAAVDLVIRLRARCGGGAHYWTLPGQEVGEYVARRYEPWDLKRH